MRKKTLFLIYFFKHALLAFHFFILFFNFFLPAGTSLQSVAGDTEAWADIWGVQSQVEAERLGQGQNGLWQI